jgi:hypothetical protein
VVKEHKCIREINKTLKVGNTMLVRNMLNPNHIFVATQKIEKKRGQKTMSVIATYCPFCGEKMEAT